MATRKTATSRKATTRKRATKAATGATVKITVGGVKKTFKRSTCHTSKGAASSAADAIRSKGGTARVMKNSPGSYCVYKGPRKAKARK